MIHEKLIEYLLAIVDTGGFNKAAEKLYVSQPALSRMIKDAEKEIGAKIFDRSQNPIKLTYVGEKYLEACLKIVDINKSMKYEINDILGGKAGKIRLGLSPHLSRLISHKIIPEFKKEFPLIEIELIEKSTMLLEEMVRLGQVDIAIVYNKSYPNLHYEMITQQHLYLAIPPTYQRENNIKAGIENNPIDIEEIKDEPFILLKKERGLRIAADNIFKEANINPNIVYETEMIDVAHQLSKADIGFTFIAPMAFVESDREIIGAYSPIKGHKVFNTLYFCLNDNKYRSIASQEFLKLISKSINAIIPSKIDDMV